MTMILENNMSEAGSMATSKKKTTSSNDITRALNFGNVSTQVSFNDGNSEGYYKVRPKALKPSDHNPRPDWVIDDNWLIKHVGVDMHDIFESDTDSNCLVKLQEDTVDNKSVEYAIYPEFEDLLNSPNVAQKKEYEFLVNLSKSIRTTGQIQPIEIESNTESNTLVVLEGHLRRLACILGRVPYIKAIRNEGLHNLSRKEKIERQITENSLRSNVTVYGNYKLACEEIEEGKKLTVRDLSSRLKIQRDLAAAFIKLISNPIKYHPLILQTLAAGNLSANYLIKVVSLGRQDRQESFLIKLLQKNNLISSDVAAPIISRGTEGRKRSVASMQIKTTENCIKAGNKLLSCIPDLKSFSNISEVSSVDDMVSLLKSFEDFLLEVNREI